METTQQNFRFDENYMAAIEKLCQPIPGVIRGKTEVMRAAVRSEWERVFPLIPFPGSEDEVSFTGAFIIHQE